MNLPRILLIASILFAGTLLAATPLLAHEHLTIQEQLGYPADAKLLIIHADDLGVAHSENIATFQALEEGVVTSASVMMPTPWAKEAALYAIENPDADLGVHITLTAEWETYKWGPMLGADTVPSLVDEHGHFHPDVATFSANAKLEELEAEVRSQIEAAQKAGIAFTHLDGHMGSMLATDEIAQLYFRLGKEYGVPVRLHQHHAHDSNNSELREAVVQMPGKVTTIQGAAPRDFPDGMAASYNQYLRELEPGLNLLVLHLGFDDDEMQAITVNHPLWGAKWRQADYDWSMSEEAKAIIKEEGIILVDWRLVKEKLFDSE